MTEEQNNIIKEPPIEECIAQISCSSCESMKITLIGIAKKYLVLRCEGCGILNYLQLNNEPPTDPITKPQRSTSYLG